MDNSAVTAVTGTVFGISNNSFLFRGKKNSCWAPRPALNYICRSSLFCINPWLKCLLNKKKYLFFPSQIRKSHNHNKTKNQTISHCRSKLRTQKIMMLKWMKMRRKNTKSWESLTSYSICESVWDLWGNLIWLSCLCRFILVAKIEAGD